VFRRGASQSAPGGKPAEFVLDELLAAAPAAFLAHDHRVEFAGIVGIEQLA
jgi:hypothetical protein